MVARDTLASPHHSLLSLLAAFPSFHPSLRPQRDFTYSHRLSLSLSLPLLFIPFSRVCGASSTFCSRPRPTRVFFLSFFLSLSLLLSFCFHSPRRKKALYSVSRASGEASSVSRRRSIRIRIRMETQERERFWGIRLESEF